MFQVISNVALIGGGLIGAGWAARFVLNGINVKIHDPSPEIQNTVEKTLANAERAYSKLTMAPLGRLGKIEYVNSIKKAVENADFIQENAPERIELKKTIFSQIDQFAPVTTPICSSTSGIKPTQLQQEMDHPERLMVGHPFNPVYLLPIVEICGGEKTSEKAQQQAYEIFSSVGMKPLIVRKEIDAFIGDRLLEAVWRESLWLINDGVATTEELDDVIRFGFGLRWAQMGLFETYRVAGGDAGFRHFISQFGPTLSWPWTKLMDVPDLNDELIDKIVDQSDSQSGKYSIRELERIRDDNLVGIMQALKPQDWGAGALLKKYDDQLYKKAHSESISEEYDLSKPLNLYNTKVRPSWLDYNNHMTESRYLQVFGDATDAFLQFVGLDEEYRQKGFSLYTLETHIRYLLEVPGGDDLILETQLLGYDQKRFRIINLMIQASSAKLMATGEHMILHVDTNSEKACPMPEFMLEKLENIWQGHQNLTVPEGAGQGIREIKN